MDALLKEFKDQYPNVFVATIKDTQFIFRELTRKEYKRITEDTYGNDYGLEEAICKATVLHPKDYDFAIYGRAGLAKTLSAEIITTSGFASHEQHVAMLDHFRTDMMSFESQAETVIQLVFPSTTDEEMENWTQEKLMKKLARAEWIMKEIWQMPFEFAKRTNEEEIPEEPPTTQEIGAKIREQGGDPMVALKDMIVKKPDAHYVPFPIIGGTKLLENEEVLNRVREQIQRLPE